MSALVIIIIVTMNWEGAKVTGKGRLLCAESPGSGLLLKHTHTHNGLNPFDVPQQSVKNLSNLALGPKKRPNLYVLSSLFLPHVLPDKGHNLLKVTQ